MPKNGSRNVAWNAYNSAMREADATYEGVVGPLRKALTQNLAVTEKKFEDKINPLMVQKKNALAEFKKEYEDNVAVAWKERAAAVDRAKAILKTELEAAPKKEEAVI